MRLLDLFSGAGGAAVGYSRAGFDVTGVDIRPSPRYPFAFVQADALEYLARHGHEYDAIHASPPCQAFTLMSNRWKGYGGQADHHPDLLTPTRALLARLPQPWVMENVPGARRRMSASLVLHGGMFGLRVNRPRLFESNVLIPTPGGFAFVDDPVGVYGKSADGRRLFTRSDGSEQRAARSVAEGGAAMGIDWMEWVELREAIPPAFTEWIGRHLIAHLRAVYEPVEGRASCG